MSQLRHLLLAQTAYSAWATRQLLDSCSAPHAGSVVMHLVNHATLHRGQIITMLRTFDLPIPNTDMARYCMTL
jgi:uncharacterized damage-inducible protein DinB